MVAIFPGAGDEIRHVANVDVNARVIDQQPVHPGEELAVPIDHHLQELRDIHAGVRRAKLQHAAQGVAEAETADENTRTARQIRAG